MNIETSFYKKLFESFASRTVITILSIIGTLIGIYAFFENKEVKLQYEITANTNVLDFNAEISKLEVTYDSTNLKKTDKNLRLLTIKVINVGDRDILKEHFDENDLVGILIKNGKLIEKPQLIESSSKYLNRNFKLKSNLNEIIFPKIILESNEYIILKILVLHKNKLMPKIYSRGKIAGQKNIMVLNTIDIKDESSFLKKTFYGNILIQLTRLISYFIICVIIVVIIGLISDKFYDIREFKRKNRNIKLFKASNDYNYTRMDDAVFDTYRVGGLLKLIEMKKLLISDEKINRKYKKLSDTLKNKDINNYDDNGFKVYYSNSKEWKLINRMVNDGFLIREKENLSINSAMKDTVEKFIAFLQQNDEKILRNFSLNARSFSDIDFEED